MKWGSRFFLFTLKQELRLIKAYNILTQYSVSNTTRLSPFVECNGIRFNFQTCLPKQLACLYYVEFRVWTSPPKYSRFSFFSPINWYLFDISLIRLSFRSVDIEIASILIWVAFLVMDLDLYHAGDCSNLLYSLIQ